MDYLLDTNILIQCFRRSSGYLDLLASLAQDDDLHIPSMTRVEIIRSMQEREREATYNLLDSFETVGVSVEIANNAGELIRIALALGSVLHVQLFVERVDEHYSASIG